MVNGEQLTEESELFEYPTGEVLDVDMGWPIAEKLHAALRNRKNNSNTVMDFGEDHSEIFFSDIDGARADDEPGKIKIYIRQAGEHKKVVAVVIAAGVVIGGLSALKYKKR